MEKSVDQEKARLEVEDLHTCTDKSSGSEKFDEDGKSDVDSGDDSADGLSNELMEKMPQKK